MLLGLLLGVGASVVGFSQLFGYSELFAQSNGDDVETILNLATTAEALACTHYYTALTDSKIQLTPLERAILIAALDSELYHLEFLNENGGQSLTTPLAVRRSGDKLVDQSRACQRGWYLLESAPMKPLHQVVLPIVLLASAAPSASL